MLPNHFCECVRHLNAKPTTEAENQFDYGLIVLIISANHAGNRLWNSNGKQQRLCAAERR
jgi:hypothetical protein